MRTALTLAVALAVGAAGCDSSSAPPPACAAYSVYRDLDGDGHGDENGGRLELCDGEWRAGFVDSFGDCDDGNATRWELRLLYRDADGDGRGGAAETVCAGSAPPPGFRASGDDCDDSDATRFRGFVRYPDADGDGVGASPRDVPCVGETLPGGEPLPGTGWSVFGWDPDDANASVTEPPEGDEPLLGLRIR
jgi:hypothetical protein